MKKNNIARLKHRILFDHTFSFIIKTYTFKFKSKLKIIVSCMLTFDGVYTHDEEYKVKKNKITKMHHKQTKSHLAYLKHFLFLAFVISHLS